MRYFDLKNTPTTQKPSFAAGENCVIETDESVCCWFEPLPAGYQRAYDVNGYPFNELIPPYVMPTHDYKEQKKDDLELKCESEITLTFLSSSAHTEGYRYDCTRDAQYNAMAAYVSATATGEPQWIYTHDGTEFRQIAHTEAQALIVVSDMRQHVAKKQVTLSLAKNAINALSDDTATCADVDAIVNAIAW